MTSRDIAKLIAQATSLKKAEGILVLDMRKVVNFCDYFVICSGSSDRHVKAIAQGIYEDLEQRNLKCGVKQGLEKSDWVILDLGDVVAHIFKDQSREFYGLEYLWRKAREVEWAK